MMTDPIADMLTRIRNAARVRKHEVIIPFSKLKQTIANILVREGYLAKAEVPPGGRPALLLTLKYADGESVIQHLKRLSTPGHRRYIKKSDVKPVLNGLGIALLSTPRGVLTNKEARVAGVGGELICEVY